MRTDDACSGGQDDSDAADLGTGRLVPLKTTLETRKRDTVVEVYVTAVPIKAASGALRYVEFIYLQVLCHLSKSLVWILFLGDLFQIFLFLFWTRWKGLSG